MCWELHLGSGGTWTSGVISHGGDLSSFFKGSALLAKSVVAWDSCIRKSTGTRRNPVSKKAKFINIDINPLLKPGKAPHTYKLFIQFFIKKLMQIMTVTL